MHIPFRIDFRPLLAVVCLLTILGLIVGLSRCSGGGDLGALSREEKEAQTLTIAADYAQDQDLSQAETRLGDLDIANATQWVVMLAERHITDGAEEAVIRPLAELAGALGSSSAKVALYLAPSPTPVPTATPTTEPAPTTRPTSTPVPPTATPEPPTPTEVPPTPAPEPATPTPTPQPQIIVKGAVNVRSGPGTAYPLLGSLEQGQEFEIVGRDGQSDWWQFCCLSGDQGWVSADLVDTAGPVAEVAVAASIPPPPATPTPAPPTATPEPTRPAVDYVVAGFRLRPIGQDAQRCNAGENSIWVYVEDPAGNPVDGARVREIFSNRILVTGAQGKGPGRVQYDIYRGGGGQMDIIDEAGNRISELSRGASADWPDFDLMKAAGYCACKPHGDDASCESDLANKTYLFAVGHYTFEVVFRRTY